MYQSSPTKTGQLEMPRVCCMHGHSVLHQFCPRETGLVEMQGICGVQGMQYCSSLVQQAQSIGNTHKMWHAGPAVLYQSSLTGTGLLEMARGCGVEGV